MSKPTEEVSLRAACRTQISPPPIGELKSCMSSINITLSPRASLSAIPISPAARRRSASRKERAPQLIEKARLAEGNGKAMNDRKAQMR